MRKSFIIILLALMPIALRAQSDSIRVSPAKVGTDTIALASDSMIVNGIAQEEVAEAPANGSTDEPMVYRTPSKNPLRYFGSPFAAHFFETPFMIGGYDHDLDVGIGLNYTYLPEVWGFNISTYGSINAGWYLAGADYRLSKPWNHIDWQLYGNVGFRHSHFTFDDRPFAPALAVGARMNDANRFNFGLTSVTMGMLTDFRYTYFTLGVSITLLFISPVLVVL